MPDGERVRARFHYDRPFREATEVSINGSPFVPVLWEPRDIVAGRETLRVGANSLVTRVYTSLIRSFEGSWFDEERHCTRQVGD